MCFTRPLGESQGCWPPPLPTHTSSGVLLKEKVQHLKTVCLTARIPYSFARDESSPQPVESSRLLPTVLWILCSVWPPCSWIHAVCCLVPKLDLVFLSRFCQHWLLAILSLPPVFPTPFRVHSLLPAWPPSLLRYAQMGCFNLQIGSLFYGSSILFLNLFCCYLSVIDFSEKQYKFWIDYLLVLSLGYHCLLHYNRLYLMRLKASGFYDYHLEWCM